MTLRGADIRFVLPHCIETALVVGAGQKSQLAAVRAGLDEAGIRVSDRPAQHSGERPDVVIAAARDAAEALQEPGRMHLLLGRVPSGVRRRARGALPMLVRGTPDAPQLILPLDTALPLRHHLTEVAAPHDRLTRGRNRGLATLTRLGAPAGALVPARAVLTLVPGQGESVGPPAVLAAAETLGVRPRSPWILSLGTGDDLQRAVFHVFDRSKPAWVVKFSRVPGYEDPFLRDAAGLALARAAGGAVAEHAPKYLGRLAVGASTASVETAGQGRPLVRLLAQHPWPLIDAIAEWTLQGNLQTARRAAALAPERARVRQLLAEVGPGLGAGADVVDNLPPIPGVLQHNDLGSWNIICDGRDFTVVDWESALEVGFPLWDLLYFAADVLARVDGPADPGTLLHRTLRVFSGRSPHSARLFRWLRSAAGALDVPTSALGAVATLCWLHHGQSAGRRRVDLRGAAPAPLGHLALLAQAWLVEPDLGISWRALTG
jgi:hypothetical protein